MKSVRLTQTPSEVLLFPGTYGEDIFYEYWAAWVTKGKSRLVLCNCHNGEKDENCVLCHYQVKDKNATFIPKPRVAINAIELADFHVIEKSNDKGSTWEEWIKCHGKDPLGRNLCEHCNEGHGTTFGRRSFITLGKGYWNNFQEIVKAVGESCKNCGGQLFVSRYACGSCGHTFLDPAQTTVSKEHKAALETEEVACPACDTTALPTKELQCYKDLATTPREGCSNPEPATVFDVPLKLRINGEKAASTLVCENEGFKVVSPEILEQVQDLLVPWDFPSFFGHMPVGEQASNMIVEVPDFGASSSSESHVDKYK